ncbi:MAG: hypothetical protein DWQ01_07600 [Planctomycetota bacterium]|nr:MAG: hypothetical protein DWQ01_07600 [Planctomycetota bacterium]
MTNSQRKEDWRRKGQEAYLRGAFLNWRRYSPKSPEWEHEHCEFCFAKISTNPADENAAYATEDLNCWICKTCFQDFSEEFNWVVSEE